METKRALWDAELMLLASRGVHPFQLLIFHYCPIISSMLFSIIVLLLKPFVGDLRRLPRS